MKLSWRSAVDCGVGLGLITGFAILGASNDFSLVFRPAACAVEPYDASLYQGLGFFAYPVWNVYALRPLAYLSPVVGLVCIYALNVIIVLALAPYWDIPSWLVLLSPVFLRGLHYAQPFEALVLMGLTLIAMGRQGLGLCLLAFKPQIGFAPALLVALRKPKAVLLPLAMAVVVTGLDLALTGRLWVGPWWQALHAAPAAPWNDSLWGGLKIFSLLWIPVGLWLLGKMSDVRRELWVATAVGMLCMPYWTSISLWPLVAMVGCWHDGRLRPRPN